MSTPHDNYSDSKYPEDKVTHYPKSKGLSKRQESGVGSKLMQMARRLKGLQETKHFGAQRRARHKAAKKAKLTGNKMPF